MSDRSDALTAWEALFRAQVTVLRELGAEFPTGQLSLTEYDVLFNLSRQPGHQARIRDLTKQLLITQPSVSRLIDRLAARGLVTKQTDADDARGIIVTLTGDGYGLFRRVAVDHAASIQRRVGSALSTEELRTLTVLCDKLRRAEDTPG